MKVLAILLVCLGTALAQNDVRKQWQKTDCSSCDVDACPKPKGCPAGIVLDNCNCCEVCAKGEYELCDHTGVPPLKGIIYGKCGENLECRLRSDLSDVEGPEALCYCERTDVVCGTDENTYDNICQLMAAAAIKSKKIKVKSKGPCNSAPVIVSPPTHTRNMTGDDIYMLCEAKGFPIPTIEWTWTRVDGKTDFLPSDDIHVSINVRGGPEKWEVTGWLQIMGVQKHHEGDYTCIAQNKYGVQQASARVNVEDDPRMIRDEN